MKRWIITICLLISVQLNYSQTVKEIQIPKNVKTEEGVFKETFISNLSEAGIYQYTQIGIAGQGRICFLLHLRIEEL